MNDQQPVSPGPDRQAAIDAAVGRMRVLNDQLAVFHAVRAIVFAGGGTSADHDSIRELYNAYDAKHPTEGTPQ